MTEPTDPSDSNESMRYGLIGDDTLTTADKLAKYTGDVDWTYIKPHFESGALLYVDSCLDLTTVGEAFANDESEKVQAWLKSGDLVKPSEPHAVYWEESNAHFMALVVSPFVLIQPLKREQ